MNIAEIGWLAGMLDRSGSFRLNHGKYPFLQMKPGRYRKEILPRLMAFSDGATRHIWEEPSVVLHSSTGKSYKMNHENAVVWWAYGPRAIGIVQTVLPLISYSKRQLWMGRLKQWKSVC